MLPANYPDKEDVVSAIFEDLLTGVLKRDDVRARVQSYIAAHNRMFPTKYDKFGDRPLLSLDEVRTDPRPGATTSAKVSGTRGSKAPRRTWRLAPRERWWIDSGDGRGHRPLAKRRPLIARFYAWPGGGTCMSGQTAQLRQRYATARKD
jgi:hypothetical protein